MKFNAANTIIKNIFFQDAIGCIRIKHFCLNGRLWSRLGIVDQIYRSPDFVILLWVESAGDVCHHEGIVFDVGRTPGKLPPHFTLIIPILFPCISVQYLGRDRDSDQSDQEQPSKIRLEREQNSGDEQDDSRNWMESITLVGIVQ